MARYPELRLSNPAEPARGLRAGCPGKTRDMSPLESRRVAERLESLAALEGIAGALQAAAAKAVPQESRLKDLLSGTWLGHPVHPPLTDVVIGSWTSALVLDLLGGEGAEEAAERLVAVGIAAAVPTAASGLSDWAEVQGGRRVGSVHAIGNVTALALQGLSWAARRRGHRGLGVALLALGYGVTGLSASLGGHLVFGEASASIRRRSRPARANGLRSTTTPTSVNGR